jgi:tRNA 5-methylaminomethyl-2-thiouridine biosynthesis bifunctional protein
MAHIKCRQAALRYSWHMAESTHLDWQDGQPVSRRFGDVYFSRASGIEETRHVFLRHNHLEERWRALPPGAQFVIGETGFGTGLNFLCAWQLWNECAPDATLHYVTIEKYPLFADELTHALSLWPQLSPWRDALLAQYRDLPPGWHRFVFDGRVTLTIAVGDIAACMPQLDMQADAWFLDGFAPTRNPEMWSADILNAIARHSHPGSTFATYTAAGEVRRGLQAAGFAVERVKGHGVKREMLRGMLQQSSTPIREAVWYRRPSASHADHRAIVIGGGLAGTSAAASLAARGWHVTLIERHATLAAEASGNPQGILYTRLATQPTALRSLVVSGYCHTLRLLRRGLLSDHDWQLCGLLQLAFDESEAARQRKLLEQDFSAPLFTGVDSAEASTLSGVSLTQGGLYFPHGGWVDPAALCRAFANGPRITLRLATEALRLQRAGAEWEVHDAHARIASAPIVVIAGAHDTVNFEVTHHLPLKTIRGQLSLLPQTPESARLRTIVCGESYVAPARDGSHTLGATHKFRDTAIDIRADEHRENLAMLRALAPTLYEALHADELDSDTLPGRAGIRVSTPDYLPIVGPLVDAAAFTDTYAALRHDATLQFDTPAPWLPGLYVSTGHGSRGLITAPLAGEILASYINNEPAPLPIGVMQAIHPSRFLLRGLIRRETSGE